MPFANTTYGIKLDPAQLKYIANPMRWHRAKNKRRLLYRALARQFGYESLTELYNSGLRITVDKRSGIATLQKGYVS